MFKRYGDDCSFVPSPPRNKIFFFLQSEGLKVGSGGGTLLNLKERVS